MRSLEGQLRAFHQAGVVVYLPLETKHGMATVRFESSSSADMFSKRLVKVSSLSGFALTELTSQAGQPLGNTARTGLKEALLPADRSDDSGKTVFIVDSAYYGLLPEFLDVKDSAVLSSASLDSAVRTLHYLQQARVKPTEFTAFVGYPETAADLSAVFGNEKTARLDTWRQRASDMRKLSGEFGFRLYGSPELNKLPNKEAIWKEIENSTGIIWITAHTRGCRMRLSSGETVEISADDIASLHLTKHPFVIVRACNGNEAGFGKAFISAGASGVWVNQGKVLASEVNSQLRQFLEAAQQGTIAEALKKVQSSSPQAATGTGLHVKLVIPVKDYESKD